MCLAIPARVVALPATDIARIDLSGVQKEISLALVDDVRIGDYVIVHVGYALTKLDPEEAELTLAMMGEAGLLDAAGSTTARAGIGAGIAPAPAEEAAE